MSILRFQLVGMFTVHRDGQSHTGRSLGSRKARTLLALLAVECGRPAVSVDRIAEVLWGDKPPQQPAGNVATMVSRLRATLGRSVVVGDRAGYRLGGAIRTDLCDAAEMAAQAQARLASGEPLLALATAAGALDLLGAGLHGGGEGGDTLADEPDASWAEQARAAHVELLRRARHTAAAAGLHTGNHAAATAAAEAAVAADPFDEFAHQALMRAYNAKAEPARALLAYEQLRTALTRELGVAPEPATQDLHMAILRGQVPPLPTGRRG